VSPVLRGEKVILREKRPEDARNDYRWRTDPELARLDATVPLRISYEEFLAWYQYDLNLPSPRSRRFAIETLDGKHIGNCMYYDVDYHKGQAELGIMIGERDYWGKGYGTDAVRTLLGHIFTETPLRKVYLHTLIWNERAQRAFQKAGFVPVRRVRREGQEFLYMEITRERWKALQRGEAPPGEQAVAT